MSNAPLTMLVIMDGWGLTEPGPGNAVHLAHTPNYDRYLDQYPQTALACAGTRVGLPEGQMGNSEVGHLNLGAGRVIFQDTVRISSAIEGGRFYHNQAFTSLMDQVKAKGKALHLMGLVSDGGVHSLMSHLYALLETAHRQGLSQVFVHAFLDGRDTPPHGGKEYLAQLIDHMDRLGLGRVASLGGRYWGMDRDKRWPRVEKHFVALTQCLGRLAEDPLVALSDSYQKGETDEFVKPTIITDDGAPIGLIKDGDGVIFFNFRADRARELTRALTDPGFSEFTPETLAARPRLTGMTTMTLYDFTLDLPIAFPPVHHQAILGEIVSQAGIEQLRIAETEKYAHVTYFFNGGIEKPFPGEDRVLIPSPREVDTYDQQPEMSAALITDEVIRRMENDCPGLIILNFANGDMVGHTGNLEATVTACATVDECVGRIEKVVMNLGGVLLVTSDHGNAEKMLDRDGQPYTAHSPDNPVPFIMLGTEGLDLDKGGALCDVAPTILELMGLPIQPQMTGRSLLIPKGDSQ